MDPHTLAARLKREGIALATEKHRYTDEHNAWLATHAARADTDALRRAFNARFDTALTSRQIHDKCLRERLDHWGPEPDAATLLARARWRYTTAHTQWLRAHASAGKWADIERAFAAEFGASPGVVSIGNKCRRMGIAHTSYPDPLSAEQRRWLIIHAPGATARAIASAFLARFARPLSAERIGRFRAEHRIRTPRHGFPFDAAHDRFLQHHAPRMNSEALGAAFNARFRTALSAQRIARRCAKLHCKPMSAKALHTPEQRRWVAANAPAHTLIELTRLFNARFALSRTGEQIRHVCRTEGVSPIHGAPSTAEPADAERRWIVQNAPHMDNAALTRAYNERFATSWNHETVRSLCKRIGVRSLERYHLYTEEQRRWLRDQPRDEPTVDLTERFNARWGTRVKPASLHHACLRFGARERTRTRAPTPPGQKPRAAPRPAAARVAWTRKRSPHS